MVKKNNILFFFIFISFICVPNLSYAQNNSTNTIQPDLGGSGSSGIGEPSTFEPTPVDGNNPLILESSSDPGGPGGDIDDLGAIPLDGGISILLIMGLLGGLVLINNKKQKSSVSS